MDRMRVIWVLTLAPAVLPGCGGGDETGGSRGALRGIQGSGRSLSAQGIEGSGFNTQGIQGSGFTTQSVEGEGGAAPAAE